MKINYDEIKEKLSGSVSRVAFQSSTRGWWMLYWEAQSAFSASQRALLDSSYSTEPGKLVTNWRTLHCIGFSSLPLVPHPAPSISSLEIMQAFVSGSAFLAQGWEVGVQAQQGELPGQSLSRLQPHHWSQLPPSLCPWCQAEQAKHGYALLQAQQTQADDGVFTLRTVT